MEGAEDGQRRYVVVDKGRARYGIRGIPLGSMGHVEAEAAAPSSSPGSQGAELAVRLLRSSGSKGVVTVRRKDVVFVSLRQAQMLLFVMPEHRRLQLLRDASWFAAIGKLGAGDLVVVRQGKRHHSGLFKSLVELRHRDSAVDLLMLGFEVELSDLAQQKGTRTTPPLLVCSAGDITEVPSRCLAASGNRVTNGPAEDTGKAISRFSSLPNLGPHCPAGAGGGPSFSSAEPLEVGSVVEVTTEGGVPAYGVVRWLGVLKGRKGTWAGVELDYEVAGCTDGTFGSQHYFTCKENHAAFVPLNSCRPDSRFQPLLGPVAEILQDEESSTDTSTEGDEEEVAPPIPESKAVSLLEGRMRGIQGYFNSCYLDVTLFSLFSSSTVLDSAFRDTAGRAGSAARILHRDIVNKLRRQGFVPAENVMNFRRQLGCDSFVTEEKDPEEFVTVLLKQVLGMKPLLKIRSHNGCTQEAFTFPLILDKDQVGPVPTVQQLLETSFQSCDLKFEEVPSCLMIQMPRFGKKYKMFPQIIPTTELDVTDLLHDSLRECFICGRLACIECPACLSDRKFQPGRVKQYCSACSVQVHSHPLREGHQVRVLPRVGTKAENGPLPRQRLQLLAVLCIQTSHYVAFVKHGPGARSWFFFDSMADCCEDGKKSFSVPEVRACPELGDFLARSEEDMATADVTLAGEYVRRLLCDSYMCLYHRGHVGKTDSVATATQRTHPEWSDFSLV